MIKIIQDNDTAVTLGGSADAYLFPNGTTFNGFLRITEESSGLLNCSLEWFINDATSSTNGLSLPYGVGVIINEDNRADFNAALLLNTNIVVADINALFPNLNGKIEVIAI